MEKSTDTVLYSELQCNLRVLAKLESFAATSVQKWVVCGMKACYNKYVYSSMYIKSSEAQVFL